VFRYVIVTTSRHHRTSAAGIFCHLRLVSNAKPHIMLHSRPWPRTNITAFPFPNLPPFPFLPVLFPSGVDLLQNKGVGVSQVKPSNCFRRLEKLVLPSIFDTSLLSFMMSNLKSYPTNVLYERM